MKTFQFVISSNNESKRNTQENGCLVKQLGELRALKDCLTKGEHVIMYTFSECREARVFIDISERHVM